MSCSQRLGATSSTNLSCSLMPDAPMIVSRSRQWPASTKPLTAGWAPGGRRLPLSSRMLLTTLHTARTTIMGIPGGRAPSLALSRAASAAAPLCRLAPSSPSLGPNPLSVLLRVHSAQSPMSPGLAAKCFANLLTRAGRRGEVSPLLWMRAGPCRTPLAVSVSTPPLALSTRDPAAAIHSQQKLSSPTRGSSMSRWSKEGRRKVRDASSTRSRAEGGAVSTETPSCCTASTMVARSASLKTSSTGLASAVASSSGGRPAYRGMHVVRGSSTATSFASEGVPATTDSAYSRGGEPRMSSVLGSHPPSSSTCTVSRMTSCMLAPDPAAGICCHMNTTVCSRVPPYTSSRLLTCNPRCLIMCSNTLGVSRAASAGDRWSLPGSIMPCRSRPASLTSFSMIVQATSGSTHRNSRMPRSSHCRSRGFSWMCLTYVPLSMARPSAFSCAADMPIARICPPASI
mmetsp:Transcript_12255/g.29883  ORF Transcript_12255/g.29883 Transcript_12255/m.29883 type:complete len:457 (-) Transcript_12255:59-1429(-)